MNTPTIQTMAWFTSEELGDAINRCGETVSMPADDNDPQYATDVRCGPLTLCDECLAFQAEINAREAEQEVTVTIPNKERLEAMRQLWWQWQSELDAAKAILSTQSPSDMVLQAHAEAQRLEPLVRLAWTHLDWAKELRKRFAGDRS